MTRCILFVALLVACGDDDARHLADAAGFPATDIVSTPLAFDDGECGRQPVARSLTFSNAGTAPMTWSASIDGAGFAIVGAASGDLAPGAAATVGVQPDTVPASASVGQMIEATLVIQTDARTEPFAVPLALQVHGGALVVETPAIAFGQIQVSVPAGATPLVIRNGGDRPIEVALGAPGTGEFSATWAGAPAAATVNPGEALAGATSDFTPAADGARTDSLAIVATGPVCAGDVATVALAGEGTFAQIGVTPGAIAYGTTPCGSTAASRDVTIANNYDVAITYTAQVMAGPYAIAPANQSGAIAANSSVVIPVAATAVPRAPTSLGSNVLDGSVRVTTNAPGHSPATIALDQAASGAVLSLVPAPGSVVAFGDVIAGTPEVQGYSVANTGTVAATVTVATTGSGFSASVPGTGSIPATGVAQAGTITQTVAARGMHAGTFTLSTTTNRCQTSPPGALDLTATALAPVVQIGRVDAMALQCGGGASAIASIPVRNSGDAPLVLSAPSVSSGFALTTLFPVMIDPGDTATIGVRASAAVIGTDRGGTQRTGTLRFRTNEIGAPERTIDLAADINGANIDFEFPIATPITSLAFVANQACPADRLIGIRNSGNQAVSFFEWSTPPPTHFRFATPVPSATLDPGELTTTRVHVVIPDQQCAIIAPELLRFRTMGTNICTARNGQNEVVLPATYRITGLSVCTCD